MGQYGIMITKKSCSYVIFVMVFTTKYGDIKKKKRNVKGGYAAWMGILPKKHGMIFHPAFSAGRDADPTATDTQKKAEIGGSAPST